MAGTTSRTLRHYGELGLLSPTRVGANGYRHYDERALVRLQRILVLRQLGLALPVIRSILDGQRDDASALADHLEELRRERARLDRQIAAVEATVRSVRGGERLMVDEMFDGFDHARHRREVEERWGAGAYARGDAWWRGMSEAERADWKRRSAALLADWRDAAGRGIDPGGAEALALARRQAEWLAAVPGTPGHDEGRPAREYLLGLGEMYVADERFARNYGGADGAAFVRDALRAYVAREY